MLITVFIIHVVDVSLYGDHGEFYMIVYNAFGGGGSAAAEAYNVKYAEASS